MNLWKQTINVKYWFFIKNGTWELTKLSNGRKPMSCEWVFRVKRNAKGKVDQYKVWLVARGFSQTHGIDFDETYAHVAKFVSIRTMFVHGTILDLEIHQMDVNCAFLNGKVFEEVYMMQLEGFKVLGTK